MLQSVLYSSNGTAFSVPCCRYAFDRIEKKKSPKSKHAKQAAQRAAQHADSLSRGSQHGQDRWVNLQNRAKEQETKQFLHLLKLIEVEQFKEVEREKRLLDTTLSKRAQLDCIDEVSATSCDALLGTTLRYHS